MADPAIPDLTERLRIRRRRGRGRRMRPVVVSLVALALAASLAYLVRFSPVFDVRDVQVRGATLVGADEVRSAAGVPDGVPLASVDPGAVAQRVARLAPVARASVTRTWPHTITIEVTQRTAVYQRIAGHHYQWVDDQGVIFHDTPTASRDLLQVATPDVANALLADVASVVTALPADLRTQVAGVTAVTRDDIVLTLKDGRRIVWGSADSSALKGQVALALLHVRARVYDVSSPQNPTSR